MGLSSAPSWPTIGTKTFPNKTLTPVKSNIMFGGKTSQHQDLPEYTARVSAKPNLCIDPALGKLGQPRKTISDTTLKSMQGAARVIFLVLTVWGRKLGDFVVQY